MILYTGLNMYIGKKDSSMHGVIFIGIMSMKQPKKTGSNITNRKKRTEVPMNDSLENIKIRELQEEIKYLNDLIKKSDLIEVKATKVELDSCGKPILVPNGIMLVPRNQMNEVIEKTKLLQELANAKREIEKLKRSIYE